MTAPTTTSPPTNTQTLWVMIVAIVLTVGSYVAWLGWSDDTSADQVLGLVTTLSVMVAVVTYRLADLGRATIATGVVASRLTVTIWIDFASDLRGHEAVWAGPVAIFVGAAPRSDSRR
jgi:drug/metabolite transporter superfamily protein YnfA